MSAPRINSKSPTIRRILKEAQELTLSPSPDFSAAPLETDLFEWHFTLRGPPNSPFESGIYHGRIALPQAYPLRPPSFRFLTPSGRFEVNREICLSISGHHEETWQPAWGVRTALVALRTFMETDVKGQLGGLETGPEIRKKLAAESGAWRCGGGCSAGKTNREIMEEHMVLVEEADAKRGGAAAADKKVEDKVPEELRMGWRDEMKPSGEQAKEEVKEQPAEDKEAEREDARLAEMFVKTGNPPPPAAAASSLTGTVASPAAVIPPTAAAERPVAPAPAQQQIRQLNVARRATVSQDWVQVWLDRLIVMVAVVLAAVVAKVMLD